MFDGIIRTLNDVRFIPSMCKNLISLGTLVEKGYKFSVDRNVLCVMAGDKVILRGRHRRNLYVLAGSTICGEAHVIASQEEMALLWHRRLGYMSKKGMEVLRKQDLLSGLKSSKLEFCEHCVFGKNKQSAFGVGIHHSTEVLEYAHSDVWGKSPVPSHSRKEYYISFINDYSRYMWVYFLHHKSEVFAIFVKWKAQVETQTGKKVRCLRSDNGGKYISSKFEMYCEQEGITHHLTMFYTPEQNGVVERLNRTLLEQTRSMLSHSGLPPEFWAEAANTATYLVNLSPCSAVQLKTPFELWHKQVPDYSRLRVFGCVAYAHTPRKNRTKLDPKAKKCYFLGYQQGVKGYRLWDPIDCKLIVNRDVSFNEARSLKEGEKAQAPDTDKGESHPSGVEGEIIHDINHDTPQGDLPTIVEDVFEPKEHIEEQEGVGRPVDRPPDDDQPESSMRRSAHVRGASQRYGVWFPSDQVDEHDNEDDVYVLITEEGEPSSFEEAHNSVEKAEWSAAMRKEMKSLSDNKTWELVEFPKGKQVIACRWVYKRKEGSGTGEKIFKARLVAKGFTQQKGVDYSEVFAPVAKYSTIRLLLSLVCMFGLVLDQMDVVIAFLYGLLDEEIFMRKPPGFARRGQESLVCRPLKSLSGLK
ncbi:hypothetical protein R1flu_015558 [Riccia fluitans]|uniref:Integrase catalytic domain-containing protein n=1 Tax=Riccia fluitans TaxID=41844 RepID=A0ABD1YJE2_9MARC